jgi:hypothetical protein
MNLRDNLTASDLSGAVRLLFASPVYANKKICLIEGDDDEKVYGRIFEDLEFHVCDGKANVLKVLNELLPKYSEKLFGICDADYDHLLNHSHVGVFLTDENDLELTILSSTDLIVNTLSCELVYKNHREMFKSNVLSDVFEISYQIGLFRLMNTKDQLGLNFKALNYNEFIRTLNEKLEFSQDCFISQLLQASKGAVVTSDELLIKLSKSNKNLCKWQICRGHDVTNIMAIAVKCLKLTNDGTINSKKIEGFLRTAVRRDDLMSKKMCLAVQNFVASAPRTQ